MIAVIDSPSIVPDQATLDLITWLAEVEVSGDRDLAAKSEDIFTQQPELRPFVHTHAVGIRASRAAAERRAYRDGEHRVRNSQMAADCIKLRRDPFWDDRGDTEIIRHVGRRHGFKSTQGAIDAVKDGLNYQGNQRKIQESSLRRRVGQRRSIFDGSKRTK